MDLTDDRRIAAGRIQQRAAAKRDTPGRARCLIVAIGCEAQTGQRLEHSLPPITAGLARLVDKFASPLDAGGSRIALRVRAGASQMTGQRGRQPRVVADRYGGVGGRRPIQRGRTPASERGRGGAFDEPKPDDCLEMFSHGIGVQIQTGGCALRVLFDAHLTDENERILPIVAADPEVSLIEVDPRHARTPRPCPLHQRCRGFQSCGCGEHDADDPVLDVREVAHSSRHATVFGAFDAVPAGGALVLVAPHGPIPLLHQLDHRTSGRLEIHCEQRGPEAWRLRPIKR